MKIKTVVGCALLGWALAMIPCAVLLILGMMSVGIEWYIGNAIVLVLLGTVYVLTFVRGRL